MAASIDDAKRGSAAALDVVLRRCWTIAWPNAFSVIGNREAAEDATQEALTRILRGLASFDSRLPLEPWVRRIAVNAALNELRKERRQPLPLEWVPETGNAQALPDEPFSSEALFAAVAALPPEKRTILALHYWLDWPLAEIAEALGMPVGTVASHLSRARTDLRSHLEAAHV